MMMLLVEEMDGLMILVLMNVERLDVSTEDDSDDDIAPLDLGGQGRRRRLTFSHRLVNSLDKSLDPENYNPMEKPTEVKH